MQLKLNVLLRKSLFRRLGSDWYGISQRMEHALSGRFDEVDVEYLVSGVFLVSLEQGHPDIESTKDLVWDLLLEQFDGEVEEDAELEVSIVEQ